jgi:hypothetical protein
MLPGAIREPPGSGRAVRGQVMRGAVRSLGQATRLPLPGWRVTSPSRPAVASCGSLPHPSRGPAPKTAALFFTLVEAELQRLRVPFDAAELLPYSEAMWPLGDQERRPVAWAEAFLREQRPAVEAP